MVVVAPAELTGMVGAAAGQWRSLGLKSDGSIVAWGYNGHGQCNVPAPNANFVAVAAGGAGSSRWARKCVPQWQRPLCPKPSAPRRAS